jgi:hypothetical protein
MYSIEEIGTGISNPNLAMRQLNRLYYRIKSNDDYNTAGDDFLEEDWDILVILDACRFDLFDSLSTLSGQLDSRTSRGSSTLEFLKGNFRNKTLHDTVYVTGNPQLERHYNQISVEFHDFINVWKESGWDETHKTVLPETMTQAALDAADKYENKRLIFHYIQPHYPFIESDIDVGKNQLADEEPEEKQVWTQLMTDTADIDADAVIEAYQKNLETTLPYIESVIEKCRGKIVVTSDHGNLLGERIRPIPIREWGHPSGIYVNELVTVPWLVPGYESRREIVSEQPSVRSSPSDSNTAKERLKQLGYVS